MLVDYSEHLSHDMVFVLPGSPRGRCIPPRYVCIVWMPDESFVDYCSATFVIWIQIHVVVSKIQKHQLSRRSMRFTLANEIPCWRQLLTPIASIHLQACLVDFRHTISSQVLGGCNLSLGMTINPSLLLLIVV